MMLKGKNGGTNGPFLGQIYKFTKVKQKPDGQQARRSSCWMHQNHQIEIPEKFLPKGGNREYQFKCPSPSSAAPQLAVHKNNCV
jgi:hypothetical protein